MISFRCLHCEKSLKVPEEKAGATIVCPRCKERSVVPAEEPVVASNEPNGFPEPSQESQSSSYWDQVGELFAGMSPGLKWIEVLVAGLGILCLLLAILALFVPLPGGMADAVISSAMFLVPLSVVIFLVILHGHATSCPSCGRWWARTQYATEFVGREIFDKGGDSFARSTYKTTYMCGSCRHKWSATHSEEYKEFMRDRLKRHQEDAGRRRIDQE
jgi:phage FluMu protein Com